jgi:hypothetical protein
VPSPAGPPGRSAAGTARADLAGEGDGATAGALSPSHLAGLGAAGVAAVAGAIGLVACLRRRRAATDRTKSDDGAPETLIESIDGTLFHSMMSDLEGTALSRHPHPVLWGLVSADGDCCGTFASRRLFVVSAAARRHVSGFYALSDIRIVVESIAFGFPSGCGFYDLFPSVRDSPGCSRSHFLPRNLGLAPAARLQVSFPPAESALSHS